MDNGQDPSLLLKNLYMYNSIAFSVTWMFLEKAYIVHRKEFKTIRRNVLVAQ